MATLLPVPELGDQHTTVVLTSQVHLHGVLVDGLRDLSLRQSHRLQVRIFYRLLVRPL